MARERKEREREERKSRQEQDMGGLFFMSVTPTP